MTYRECLDYFNELSLHKNIDGLKDDTYFQFDVIGRDSGHFYIHLKDDIVIYFKHIISKGFYASIEYLLIFGQKTSHNNECIFYKLCFYI